ncbi:MAG TPA: exodeoxyribonuclease VII small subunit [Candidatus Saccharimonadales bacterium]
MSKPSKTNVVKLVKQIEETIDWFESGQVDIDQAIKRYQAALSAVAQLEKFLSQAKNEVSRINLKFD